MAPLQPTLDTEITALKQSILNEMRHTSRNAYVGTVKELKNNLNTLKSQNRLIKESNEAAIAAEPPTPEQVATKLNQAIEAETRLTYPYISDEMGIIRRVLATEFPDNADAKAYNDNIEAAISKISNG